jgi:porin
MFEVEEEDLFTRPRLSGDWAGVRRGFEEQGLALELDYTLDYLSNFSGGAARRTETLGNLDLLLSADLDRLLGWSGARALLYGLANHGGSISAAVGDLQGVNNIEAPSTSKLYEAWIEQDLWDARAAVLVGLYDMNSEATSTCTAWFQAAP